MAATTLTPRAHSKTSYQVERAEKSRTMNCIHGSQVTDLIKQQLCNSWRSGFYTQARGKGKGLALLRLALQASVQDNASAKHARLPMIRHLADVQFATHLRLEMNHCCRNCRACWAHAHRPWKEVVDSMLLWIIQHPATSALCNTGWQGSMLPGEVRLMSFRPDLAEFKRHSHDWCLARSPCA